MNSPKPHLNLFYIFAKDKAEYNLSDKKLKKLQVLIKDKILFSFKKQHQ